MSTSTTTSKTSLYDIQVTYPGVKGRKAKKKLKYEMTYDRLRLVPLSVNKRRNSHRTSPKRGEWVLQSGRLGRFVGYSPTKAVWVALEEYRVQFPYETQCTVFDKSWREPLPQVTRN